MTSCPVRHQSVVLHGGLDLSEWMGPNACNVGARSARRERMAAIACVGGAALVLTLAGCASERISSSPASTTGGVVGGTPTTAPSEATAGPDETSRDDGAEVVLASYFMTSSPAGWRLVRELSAGEGDRVVAAVEAMLAGPQDLDYRSAWKADTELIGVDIEDDIISVNLSQQMQEAVVSEEVAALMVQQLVYTTTEAADSPDARVRILVEGNEPTVLWGVLASEGPVGREAPEAVRLPVQIDIPGDGELITQVPVEVRGEATSVDGIVSWRVQDYADKVIRSGTTTTAEGSGFSPYSVEVNLPPGTYTIVVQSAAPTGSVATDDKTIRVRFGA